MAEKYAELRLYDGNCPSLFCKEGRFDKNLEEYLKKLKDANLPNEQKWNYQSYIEHHGNVMKRVREYLDYESAQDNHPEDMMRGMYGICNVVQNESHAKKLIEYSEKNIKGVHPVIVLQYCMHGQIRFLRKIIFDSWTKEQEKELIEKLKSSGYSPVKTGIKTLEKRLGKYVEPWNSYFKSEIVNLKRLKKISPDEPWKQALKFYEK